MSGQRNAELLGQLPLLPTTVVGSWPVPDWMERLKTDYYRGRISHSQLSDLHDVAIKAALLDQEHSGTDIVSDGELRRDNDIDYFLARLPGVEMTQTAKAHYFDYFEAQVVGPFPDRYAAPPLGLAADYGFTAAHARRPVKFSFTGPFSLAHRLRHRAGSLDKGLLLDIARVLNAEARALAEHGAVLLQIDEPFLAGYPDAVGPAIEAVNVVTEGVDVAWALHVCYGNRYARPHWEGQYDFLFPSVLDADVDQLVLEFARKGYQDLPVIQKFGWDRTIGLGVVDVKTSLIETPSLIASRIRNALELVPAEQLVVNPDCGLRHVSSADARAKLAAMVAGTHIVRAELAGSHERVEESTCASADSAEIPSGGDTDDPTLEGGNPPALLTAPGA
jgi:5-methyltetrahydropteroyltriglutamate--homocysteine methyltransferase